MTVVRQLSAIVIAVAAGLAAWGAWLWQHDGKVTEKAVRVINKATTNAANNGKRAAAKSLAAGVRGVRDPSTRND